MTSLGRRSETTMTSGLQVNPIGGAGSLCNAFFWDVVDKPRLASVVARLTAGQHLLVESAVRQLKEIPLDAGMHEKAAQAAIRKLEVPPGKDPYHRDGWLFQMIAWVAFHQHLGPNDVARFPQPRKADKGFDNLFVIYDDRVDRPRGLVICEQKATENPRKKITEDIFPEFGVHERGDRDDELQAELTALLTQVRSRDESMVLAERILWNTQRQYQAALTVEQACHAGEAVEKLFRGYSSAVTGEAYRRQAETIHLPKLREWMRLFADDVIAHLNAISKSTNV